MKKLLILLFSILISFNSYGEWIEVTSNDGSIYYIDKDSIKYHDGFIYFWELSDYLKPNSLGHMSGIAYKEVDCNLNRQQILSLNMFKMSMGRGESENINLDSSWYYPISGSVGEGILNYACNSIK